MFCCAICLLPFAALSFQLDSAIYRIYDTRTQREITLPQLADALKIADVVFFGEEHDDSVAHILEYELLKAMDERYEGVSLSMEMFVSDDQLVLQEYLAGIVTERTLMKDASLWNNYRDYRPLVEYAKTHGIPVLAANAPSRYTNRVTRDGLASLQVLDKSARSLLAPLPIDTLTGAYFEKFTALLGGHGGMENLKIYQSQNLWDATMAFRISTWIKKKSVKKVLHLNGRFHSDEQLGTVAHLRKYMRRVTTTNISCFPDASFSHPNWAAFKHLAHFIILTDPDAAKSF